jgi:hypothetical protein
MSSEQASEYNKYSYKSIRSDLNRQLQDLGRDIDIVRGRDFRSNNSILDGKLKKNLHEGLARPTKHKDAIPVSNLSKISTYLYEENNPIALRFRVWFILSMQFVSRGLQLKINYFVLKTDENGNEYVALAHETRQKIWHGGIDAAENPNVCRPKRWG